MKVGDQILYARIMDPHGLTDGLQGYATEFQLANDRADLVSIVGAEMADYYVEAPNAQCAGFYYDRGVWPEIKD